MSDETREVQYEKGEASLVLEDGQIAERGKPIKVKPDLAERLCEQGWTEMKGGKPVDPAPPKPTQSAIELAEDLDINIIAVEGTGGTKKNQVTVEDVEAYAETQTTAEKAGSTRDLASPAMSTKEEGK